LAARNRVELAADPGRLVAELDQGGAVAAAVQQEQALAAAGHGLVHGLGGVVERWVVPGGHEQHRDPQLGGRGGGVGSLVVLWGGEADHPGDRRRDLGRGRDRRRTAHRRADQDQPGRPAAAQLGGGGDHVLLDPGGRPEIEGQRHSALLGQGSRPG
jgi:hypothetical protein